MLYCLSRYLYDPHTFVDVQVSTSEPYVPSCWLDNTVTAFVNTYFENCIDDATLAHTCLSSMLKLRSCAYFPEYRLGAFGTIPLLMGNR